ncbi:MULTISPECIES: serine O-acetyltransferase [unclassified Mesorhizobium]|uniref:serine O-acetyltransferase n=1 Tax=unclassified Mesorhizobium TaxID=325217 RepID=UPI000FCAFCB1|nr:MULTISPECIES: serine O-acetyltransferase [unclassified Mesorhizobium]RUW25221.1 serine O-acetyltransferase [Mesorhizobium sp. M1E.F.Ca.ET.041.01.1.1]RWD90850.1 MAG: serine O-acetyltransferase [Mesorhizobium sp.]RWD92199.1 MAG: serine O-acetyltransferase [Mesorhizobium sp.]
MSFILTTSASRTASCTNRADRSTPPSLIAMIREDIACVKARDPAARGTLEIVLTYPGVHAIVWHRLANRLWRQGFRFPARFLSWAARLVTNVDIHPGATVGWRFFIDHGAGVVIGETAEVGDDVTLYHGVTLGGTSWAPGKRHPTLESGVLVGAGAKILGAITVGAGCRVGANAVVIKDVPPGMTVVGIPGRIVRPAAERRRVVHGRIDLDHHLMPDPVGDAVASLVDRISFLELRISRLQRQLAGSRPETTVSDQGERNEQLFR